MKEALLVLEDGAVFRGEAFGAPLDASGEVVFNTSMSGYQEVLTDPSYDGQIVVMTYPHIGNYGVNEEDVESSKIRVSGFVTRDIPARWSSWRGRLGISDYLAEEGIAGITEIDTRRLTRHIRDKGAMRGVISSAGQEQEALIAKARATQQMQGADHVLDVTTNAPYEWPSTDQARFHVAAYDFGIKHNILRLLSAHGCRVTVYPATTPAEAILETAPDGVFLSNGPGDPEAVGYGIDATAKLLGQVPVFGICLGHQLLAIAAGLKTFKLPFGHRGINHPVVRVADGAIEITTQNHGFAVNPEPFGFEAPDAPGRPISPGHTAETRLGPAQLTHVNLNDYTVEGLRLTEVPAFSVQYHPESGPGPHDARYLFSEFNDLMERAKG
ncbi:MAG TPA: glutamine-hydrolyzing carbamoyl-phosphate synthase small subunit [Actinomycetota bacterium]|nr:glutamine-hydrolyzing carbamoyl-phosphate synthase small subunit [Actinomycetota bacterium]